jgi:microcystin-dependent protein
MFKTIKGKELYRIGDCIISINSENPSKNFGGEWELLCPGRTIVCIDEEQEEFNSLKKIGGEKTHILTTQEMPVHTHTQNSHTHTAVTNTKGAHRHNFYVKRVFTTGTAEQGVKYSEGNSGGEWKWSSGISSAGDHSHTVDVDGKVATNKNAGGGLEHNNLQPFMAVYIWVRIA